MTSADEFDQFALTEERWLTTDWHEDLTIGHIAGFGSVRKPLLFGVACCEMVLRFLPNPAYARALAEFERHADDPASRLDSDAYPNWRREHVEYQNEPRGWAAAAFGQFMARDEHGALSPLQRVCNAAIAVAERCVMAVSHADATADAGTPATDLRHSPAWVAAWKQAYSRRSREVIRLVHCIFENPFRPVAFHAAWRTSTVLALAAQMYETRDFAQMPILADALHDAGCEDAAVLDHCRGESPHVRGCWVVDLILGKS